MSGAGPMDIDPIDDGPRDASGGIVPMTTSTNSTAMVHMVPAHDISKEEEARQAIEMLRGDDVSQRVAAASRLESVASVLGEERTRDVSALDCNFRGSKFCHLIFLLLLTTSF